MDGNGLAKPGGPHKRAVMFGGDGYSSSSTNLYENWRGFGAQSICTSVGKFSPFTVRPERSPSAGQRSEENELRYAAVSGNGNVNQQSFEYQYNMTVNRRPDMVKGAEIDEIHNDLKKVCVRLRVLEEQQRVNDSERMLRNMRM
ncbi:CUN037 hypothetical protein [Culex nigripalpus nucleopolyhedrovirus]|uniref:Uncharacterized protein n=1 Tax=Culex nigripalpus nucleopolyhedrovirus (isolate Florida/1997) TaxID=645993 RepID=Q919N2_NPVCO|nr:CUN037 hypothetical protein [Culex nigripalpus nucleopolyhedrovirus]AAK94115.1 CUN037 hypothetical protein [Culex nigripalpus nucleopolyhedrovirus]